MKQQKEKIYSKNWRRCVQRKCGFCCSVFDAPISMLKKKQARFCSISCRNKGLILIGEQNGNWKGGSLTRKCKTCKELFEPSRGNVKKGFGWFCSRRCWWVNRCKRKSSYRGVVFKSRWEMLFAKWLTNNGLHYRYEPKTFDVGWFNYTPDFYIREWKKYVEVKGFLSKDFKEKFEFFKKFYSPTVKIVMFGGKKLKALGILP